MQMLIYACIKISTSFRHGVKIQFFYILEGIEGNRGNHVLPKLYKQPNSLNYSTNYTVQYSKTNLSVEMSKLSVPFDSTMDHCSAILAI